MRDGHQSLLATRMRTYDISRIAGTYARALPNLLSLECWGGATFDVAMRFLTEDPWERLSKIREGAPNILLQMLLRGANGVGYTNYPDNVVKHFVRQASAGGVDLFRVFDCLNWVDNMRVSMDAVCEEDKLCEAAICYTGDILNSARPKYDLKYYTELARELTDAGAHIICVKDMAGLLKPGAATQLFKALREATDLPIHFHTHDTSGISAATVLAAVDAGVDAVDAAMDALSGNTSQPCLGSIVEELRGGARDPGLDPEWIRRISFYWEAVRAQYVAFESDLKGPASEVYLHEMPGGQFTNLKEQARSLGLETRWHEVAQTYADANQMFGDIVKVTPSSKVVGDMALMMVSQDLTVDDVEDPDRDVSFPDSVVSMMRGDLGQSPGGWPEALQTKVLKGEKAHTDRPGSLLEEADLDAERVAIEESHRPQGQRVRIRLLPDVSEGLHRLRDGAEDLRAGFSASDAILFLRIARGQRAVCRYREGARRWLSAILRSASPTKKAWSPCFSSLTASRDASRCRIVRTARRALRSAGRPRPRTRRMSGAPMPGVISTVAVAPGQEVQAGDVLLSIEAMKMETAIHAEKDGVLSEVLVKTGDQIDAKDLLVVFA